MATLIKNQIVKHFSRFAKNITPDQISVEILRGKGELYNIELNENVLAEMLELPSWMRIGRAVCSRIIIKIPWTRLKTHPVVLFIDEIRVELILSAELRDFPATGFPTVSSYSMDSYGFAHRVVEGISLRINAIEVFFASKKFGGSLMLSQISVDSRTPYWKEASSLRETRISDATLQQVLLFKQISWKTFRLEASTLNDSVVTGYNINAPLRLITSQGKFRITTKKSRLDGTVYGGRLALIMDNLLWVASLSQLQSAISFGQFIVDLIESSKKRSAELPVESSLKRKPWSFLSQLSEHQMKQDAPLNSAFHHFNVIETSFHCYVGQIDLHVCDEAEEQAFQEDWDIINGAIQVTITKLVCDFYPYHLAVGSRKHWVFYGETKFGERVRYLLENYQLLLEKRSPTAKNYEKLMSCVCVFRIYDIVVFCVTDQSSGKHHARKLLYADHEALKLPPGLPILHAETNDFYCLEHCDIPMPPSSCFVQVHPIRAHCHNRTFRWINYVLCQINSSLFSHSTTTDALTNALHADVFIELTMPWVQLPLNSTHHSEYGGRMPAAIVIRATRITLTNCKSLPEEQRCIVNQPKPSLPDNTEAYKLYASKLARIQEKKQAHHWGQEGSRELSFDHKASVDVWRMDLSPVWIDFIGDSCFYPEPSPLLCDLDMTVWAMQDANGALYCLAETENKVKLALDHYQYLFLFCAGEEISGFINTIYEDILRFAPLTGERPSAIHFWAPLVEVSLLLPSFAPPTAYEMQTTAELFSGPVIGKDKRARDSTEATVDSVWSKSNDASSNNSPRLTKAASSTSFDREKLGSPVEGNALDADVEYSYEENASLTTQLSMDDDNFTVLDEDDAGLFDEIFPMQKTVTGDLAEEVDRTPNCSDESQKIMLEKISVLRFSVDQMRVRLSSSGRLCRADLLGSCLKVEEFSTGNRHQFYESFRVKEMAGRRTTDCNLAERQYPLRVTMKNCEAALSVYVVDAFVNDLEFSVSNDCLTNLVGFVQDEKASYGSSIRVKLNLTAVRLKITDRKLPDPVCILLNSANILQGPWGNDISTVLSELQRKDSELRQLAEENDSLKRQLRAALEKLHL